MVLLDEKTIESYNVTERKFIVVMVNVDKKSETTTTPAAATVPAPTAATIVVPPAATVTPTAAAPTTTTVPASATVSSPAAVATTTASDAANASISAQSAAEAAFLMGDDYNAIIRNIMEMGYSREQVEQALRASFNNPDRAAEYLLSGVVLDNVETEDDVPTVQPPNAVEASAAPSVVSAGGGAVSLIAPTTPNQTSAANISIPTADQNRDGGNVVADPLAFLRQQPQFLQMRNMIHRNPDFLNAVLQQVRKVP